jgi:hypothetical protein
VAAGAGVGVGVDVGSGITSFRCLIDGPPRVHKIAPIASSRTIATPMERINIGDTVRLRPIDSRGEPHSGHRNSFVTTVIFSFR